MRIQLESSPEERIQAFYNLDDFEDLAKLLEVPTSVLHYILFELNDEEKYKTFEVPKRRKDETRKYLAHILVLDQFNF